VSVGTIATNGYVLAMVGHLKNVSSTFVQMPNRSKSVEFTTVSHTIANTMLAAVLFF
jgi:DNA-binding cell septation regulator SpoVG